MRVALSNKVASGRLVVATGIDVAEPKTGVLDAILRDRGLTSTLVIDDAFADRASVNIGVAARNLHYVDLLPQIGCNVYDMLKREWLVVSPAAAAALTARLHPEPKPRNRIPRYRSEPGPP